MVNSQAGMLEPGSKELILASARSSVSCTRSSARSTLPHNEMANARKLGTAARTASRTEGSRSIQRIPCSRGPLLLVLLVELLEKIVESIRNALRHHVVVHCAELLPDFGPDIAAEAGFGLGRG